MRWVLLLLPLAACATTSEPQIRDVRVPVPVACPDKRAPKPVYPDTLEAIRGLVSKPDSLVALLLSGRELRIQREAENEAQIGACQEISG